MRRPLLLLALLLGGALPTAAQVTTSTALPVAEGETIVRLQTKWLRASDDPGPADRELRVRAAPTVLVHGATSRLALFGIFPLLEKRLRVDTPLGRRSRGDSGPGDVTLLARYTAARWDAPGETRRIAPFVGLKLPTGRDDASDALGRLPQPLQLGTGSWDPIVGTVFTWQTLEREFDAALSYRATGKANDFEAGDLTRLDLSFKQRVLPGDLASAKQQVPSFLYAVLESNLAWARRNRIAGAADPDSGGFEAYLAPGLQHVTRRTVLEGALQLPVIQDLNGRALRDDYIFTLSFRMSF